MLQGRHNVTWNEYFVTMSCRLLVIWLNWFCKSNTNTFCKMLNEIEITNYKVSGIGYNKSNHVTCHISNWTIMQEGESTLSPPKIVVICIIFLQFFFLVTYGHYILDYFCFLKVYLIYFSLHLINYFEKFNKHLRNWTWRIFVTK
jgi:hypothetical protein